MNKLRNLAVAFVAALALVVTAAPAASAQDVISRTGNTFVLTPNGCPWGCSIGIGGYRFASMPYYDPSPEVDSAVEIYYDALRLWELPPPGPPITSVSVDVIVSGTVDP